VSNLLDNALKYTPSGEDLHPGGLEQGHLQGIAISNTGPGIPPEDLEHIFERHYRGVQSSSEIPGTGLGIAIDLIEQMQGEIQVFSPARFALAHLLVDLEPPLSSGYQHDLQSTETEQC